MTSKIAIFLYYAFAHANAIAVGIPAKVIRYRGDKA